MLKCGKCGYLFDEFNCVGGIKCPECGNQRNIGEIEPCIICNRYHTNCINGVCGDCQEKMSNVESALGMGAMYSEPVEINGFLLYVFGKDRIEELLMQKLREEPQKVIDKDADRYCLDDVYQFTDYLLMCETEKLKDEYRGKIKRRAYK